MAYCERCDRYFGSYSALDQHLNNSSLHNICHDCDRDFLTWTGLKEHYVQSHAHDYCQYCNTHFSDRYDLEEHYTDAHYWCQPCNRFFANDFGLSEHYRQSTAHHFCAPCNRHFISANNLQTHLNSSIHRPRTVPCRGKNCDQTFVSVSAMLLHLESGNCVSGVTRRAIDSTVRQLDRNNLITDRLLTSSMPSDPPEMKYFATSAAYNIYLAAYECYLCHSTYNTLRALNQHLASPRHEPGLGKMYICPGVKCGTKFTTLSGLCQHIESEKCGVSKFREVKAAMDGIVGQMGRLTM